MHCSGERLGFTSGKAWPQMMGEGLLLAANSNNNIAITSTTCSSSSSTITNSNNSSSSSSTNANKNSMIHANSTTSNAARVPDKPLAKDHPQGALRCPRCDSSNTKFCYYNNYSLSQPRHFCKACKRYWTRGGTLRNVPVGGGCRKNKRAKKTAAAAPAAPPSHPHSGPLLLPDPLIPSFDAASLYGLQTASPSSDMLPIILNNLNIQSCTSAFDLQPHLGTLGLGLPSNPQCNSEYHLGELQPLHPVSSTAISLLNEYPLFGSSLLSASSLLLSSIKQPEQVEDCQALLPFDELQACEMSGGIIMKEAKLEGQTSNMINSNISCSCIDNWQNNSPEISLDNLEPAAVMYWNAAIGGWPDSMNCGSSVAPLI